MTELDDATATEAIKAAGYLLGVAVLSVLMSAWLCGVAVWRFLHGEWV